VVTGRKREQLAAAGQAVTGEIGARVSQGLVRFAHDAGLHAHRTVDALGSQDLEQQGSMPRQTCSTTSVLTTPTPRVDSSRSVRFERFTMKTKLPSCGNSTETLASAARLLHRPVGHAVDDEPAESYWPLPPRPSRTPQEPADRARSARTPSSPGHRPQLGRRLRIGAPSRTPLGLAGGRGTRGGGSRYGAWRQDMDLADRCRRMSRRYDLAGPTKWPVPYSCLWLCF
jgi:hypothetical protein